MFLVSNLWKRHWVNLILYNIVISYNYKYNRLKPSLNKSVKQTFSNKYFFKIIIEKTRKMNNQTPKQHGNTHVQEQHQKQYGNAHMQEHQRKQQQDLPRPSPFDELSAIFYPPKQENSRLGGGSTGSIS